MASIFTLSPYNQLHPAWVGRTARYATYRAYYTGAAYAELSRFPAANKLYAGTRTLFSPLRRCVRVDVAKVPGGWALAAAASAYTCAEVAALRRRYDLTDAYDRFVLYGAVVGDAALVLAGSPDAPDLVALRPDAVLTGTLDGEPAALVVQRTPTEEYAQLITPSYVQEWHDGVARARHANAFGFVPVVLAHYIEAEDGTGEPAFGGVLELLDRVNELASLTLEGITRNAEPLLVATGVQSIQIAPGQDAIAERNPDAKFYTVNPNLAIAETLAVIQDVRGEYKALLPQLHLDDLRVRSDLAYDTVITMLSELGDHILAVRRGVDRAIATVERWLLDATGGTPSDYALDAERRWMTLTEAQALDLVSKRLGIDERRAALDALPLHMAAGLPERNHHARERPGGTERPGGAGAGHGQRDGTALRGSVSGER